MEAILYGEVNLLGITVVMLMLLNMKKRTLWGGEPDHKIFIALLCTCGGLLLLDTGMVLCDGRLFPGNRHVHSGLAAGYFLLNPLLCFLWLLYCDYKLTGSQKRLQHRLPAYAAPLVLPLILLGANFFVPLVYEIDGENRYHRGGLPFDLLSLLCVGYLLVALGMALWKMHTECNVERKRIDGLLALFPLLPILGGLVQLFWQRIPLVWPITTLSCLMVFINLQSDQMCTDPLTGLYNRRYFQGRLERGVRSRCMDCVLFVILLDVNEFKEINDVHGHEAGDKALTQVAEILRAACAQKGDFISRYGGDEFIILGERKHRGEIPSVLQCIRDQAEAFSRSRTERFPLSLSAGYAIFGEEENDTPSAFLRRADQRMYQQKAASRGKNGVRAAHGDAQYGP